MLDAARSRGKNLTTASLNATDTSQKTAIGRQKSNEKFTSEVRFSIDSAKI